jgi:LemA protein
MSFSTVLIIVAIIAVISIIWGISIYNTLIRLIEAIKNNQKQIDIQLDRRYKVFESLINVVKNYMDYEKSTLSQVVALRNKSVAAANVGDEKTRIDAENSISKIASGLSVVFERYPDLKANKNAMQLQEEIVNTENKLAFSKQALNDSIERYNATKKSFFESMVVSIFSSKLDAQFIYWQLPQETIPAREEYTVKL